MNDYAESVAALRTHLPQVAEEIACFGTLESVLRWMDKRGIPLEKIEIVFQDEFSHDFLIPLNPEGQYLGFAIT